MEDPSSTHTCLKLILPDITIFIKGTWFDSRFLLAVTDGRDAWICNASEEDVWDRAAQWDLPAVEYVALVRSYLESQKPESLYAFTDAGDGYKRLSWTFEKAGTTLQWRWKCQLAPNCQEITVEILNFLMGANSRLSDQVVEKTLSVERLKAEANKCLEQSERVSGEIVEFETILYGKFLRVLDKKKEKLRELRDQLAKKETVAGKLPKEEEESSGKNGSFDEESDEWKSEEESPKNATDVSKGTGESPRGRKRVLRGQ